MYLFNNYPEVGSGSGLYIHKLQFVIYLYIYILITLCGELKYPFSINMSSICPES